MNTSDPPRRINLDFADFGRSVLKNNNFFINLLRQRHTVEVTDDPDFLLYSDGSNLHRLYACKKIYWTSEPYRPDLRACDYALTSHFIDSPRHFRLPLYVVWVNPQELVREPGEYERFGCLKQEFCCFFTSKVCRKTRHRWNFFDKLSQYRPVHSAGRARNNIGATVPFNARAKNAFLQRYKFYMAFENSRIPGYTTEKIIEAMRARCVPIYWGNPRIAEEFNPRSFINANDFASEDALIEHIRRVDQDEALYRGYFEEPFFIGNRPNACFDTSRLLDFFDRILSDPAPPISTRPRLLGRWLVLKRKKPHVMSWHAPASVHTGFVK
jgi:alpha(1,3/1,4) fucosyltransferase